MNDSLRDTFGQKLLKARNALGLSQEKVAERIGISGEHYGKIERSQSGSPRATATAPQPSRAAEIAG
jgi:transcriptional regulator with XRE-family HTH domain